METLNDIKEECAQKCHTYEFEDQAAKALLMAIEALEKVAKTKFGWDGDCGVMAIAENALEDIRDNWSKSE